MNWNRIREERKKKGYTLAQVARETGYSIGYISQLERNQKEPSLAALRKIAACLGCSEAVSYTHLDVYKRQAAACATAGFPAGTADVFCEMGCTNTASSATMITTMAATIRNVFLQPTAWFKGCLLYTSRCV